MSDQVDRIIQDAMDGALSTELATLPDETVDLVLDQTKHLLETLVGFKELMMTYSCALKEIHTRFEVLNTEFKIRSQHNPINSISTRLKRTASITEKLARIGKPFTLQSIQENITDVAGIRVICPYIDDIYALADVLLAQDDIELVVRKDYIADPKPNGYRSLHLIVKVPVHFAEQRREVPVEVQIRTIAMDFWASLEHQLKYKQEIPNQQEVVAQLTACANVINSTDEKMLELRRQIDAASDLPTEEDILYEKLSKLDISLD